MPGIGENHINMRGHLIRDDHFFDGTGKIQLYSEIQLPAGEAIIVRGKIDEDSFNVTSWCPVDKPGEYRK